jgi:Zn-finger nucleic acid-binding protein/ribosomal protein L40E
VKLVACPKCHAQYDLDGQTRELVECPCGTTFPARSAPAVDAAVQRCAACGALVGETDTTCPYCQAAVVRQFAPAGPVCPQCYARNPEGARHCTACGVEFAPQPLRDQSRQIECPVCAGVALTARSLDGLWVDECPMCLGLWAPGDLMDRIVARVRERRKAGGQPSIDPAHLPRKSAWQTGVAYRKCPECGAGMQRKNFGHRSGVVVDWCGSHGTWLDANEMEDIAAFILAGGLDVKPAVPAAGDQTSALPADPARTAAILAAEQMLADEREKSRARRYPVTEIDATRALKGIGDFLAGILK